MDREQVEYKEVSFFVNNAWLQFQKINLMKAVQINQTSSVVSLKLRKNKQIRKSTKKLNNTDYSSFKKNVHTCMMKRPTAHRAAWIEHSATISNSSVAHFL